VDHVGTVLLLLQDLAKIGVLIDIGHAIQGSENVAYSAALLSRYGKLDYLHLNDNHGDWDEDLMVGSVHLVHYLELVYWLKRVGYKGWLTLDIFPYREDGVRAATECREWMEGLFRAVERLGMDTIGEVIRGADATAASALVRKAMGM
jgi:xylose isomerase